jgi:hypothetical protein
MIVKQALGYVTDIILLDTIIGLEVIKEVMEVRKIRLVRTDVFCDVGSRERAALERTRQRAIVRRMVHVCQRHKDLEVLGQALDSVDLDKICQFGDVLIELFHHQDLQYHQTPQTPQYSHQTA